MNRKDFLIKSLMAGSGLALLPSFLASCKRENIFDDSNFKGSVGIVGAGISGLYAALLLKQRGIDVQIFEASNDFGGRIKTLEGFADFKIELGAEYVHGNNSVWYDFVRNGSNNFVTSDLQDYYFLNGQIMTQTAFENTSQYAEIISLFNGLENYSSSDISALGYAVLNGLPEDLIPIWNGWVGNENGTDISKIGVSGLSFVEQSWVAGEGDFLLKAPDFKTIMLEAFSSVLPFVQYNTPISHINYADSKVKLYDADGQEYLKDRVIVTSSIQVLKDQLVTFTPNLPPLQLQAINSIAMDKGLKIILKFSEGFWPNDLASIYGGTVVPEYWATGVGGRSAQNNILTAFLNGQAAENLNALGDQMIPTILTELDGMFGGNIATNNFTDHRFINWSEQEYIRGVYSYFPVDLTPDIRGQLAVPVNNKLFFAGEASHSSGHHGTVHGAMEAAFRSVKQILESA